MHLSVSFCKCDNVTIMGEFNNNNHHGNDDSLTDNNNNIDSDDDKKLLFFCAFLIVWMFNCKSKLTPPAPLEWTSEFDMHHTAHWPACNCSVAQIIKCFPHVGPWKVSK